MSLKRTKKPPVMHTIGHQTPAVMHAISTKGGTVAVKRYKRRKPGGGRAPATSHHRAKRGRKKGSKLVAGSAAAKAWGAKMRRARKKKTG